MPEWVLKFIPVSRAFVPTWPFVQEYFHDWFFLLYLIELIWTLPFNFIFFRLAWALRFNASIEILSISHTDVDLEKRMRYLKLHCFDGRSMCSESYRKCKHGLCKLTSLNCRNGSNYECLCSCLILSVIILLRTAIAGFS